MHEQYWAAIRPSGHGGPGASGSGTHILRAVHWVRSFGRGLTQMVRRCRGYGSRFGGRGSSMASRCRG
jgi:hypothetical protein